MSSSSFSLRNWAPEDEIKDVTDEAREVYPEAQRAERFRHHLLVYTGHPASTVGPYPGLEVIYDRKGHPETPRKGILTEIPDNQPLFHSTRVWL